MFEMHILLHLACAEDAEIWCNSECFIAYSALNTTSWAQMECTEETKVRSAPLVSILVSYASETNVIYGLTFLHHLSRFP